MIDAILTWIEHHQTLTFWTGVASASMFLGSLLALPLLASLLPEDYFRDTERHANRLRGLHPLAYLALRGLKNLLGWSLILAGIVMLILPGQGLLTIFMGLILSDFPGKFALERRLAANPRILGAINWLRQRRGHLPLQPPDS